MKKFSIKAVALAAGVLAGGSAFAVVDLDTQTGAGAPVEFASEAKISGAGTTLTNAGAKLNATVKTGVAIAANTTRYVRVDLGAGAYFSANPTLATATAAATVSAAPTSGGQGSSFAIFKLDTAGTAATANDVLTLTVNNIDVVSKNAVTVRYRLFTIPAFADSPTETNSIVSTTGTLVKFAPALTFVASNGTTATADYAASGTGAIPFGKFTGGATTATLGSVTATVGTQLLPGTGNAATAIGDIIAPSKAIVTIDGDFSAVPKDSTDATKLDKTKVTFNGLPATTLTATKATFGSATTGVTLAASAAPNSLVINTSADGSVAIPVSDYKAAIDYTGATNFEVTDLSGLTVGKVDRNGTTLVAPLVNQPAGWYSRLVLTNTGNTDLAYRVAAVSEAGTTVALSGAAGSGVVPKNSTIVVDLDTLATITGTGAKPRTGLVVTVDGAGTAITGQYQIANGTTGMISNYTLVQKGN